MFVRQPGAVFSFLAKPCELPFVRSCWNFLLSATVISCFLDFSPAPACIPSALTGKPTRAGASRKTMKKLLRPQILIFDVDGVLVDVRGTYWRSALETVRYITGKRVTYAELHRWKSKPGFNDDWSMVSAWVSSLGHPTSYEEARAAFEKFYWGSDGKPGNVRNEKLMVTPKQIERWAQRFELNLFTGRTRQEFSLRSNAGRRRNIFAPS